MLRYLAVLAVMLACFTGDVSAVTDQEFQMMQNKLNHLSNTVDKQASLIEQLQMRDTERVEQMQAGDAVLMKRVEQLSEIIAFVVGTQQEIVQNTTIEERVELLEIQVANLDEDVDFLFEEQVIQDEALLNLEERMLNVETDADQIEEDIEALQDVTLALDFRVTALEENGGSDGNSSISELEERVETLEGTVGDHETRLTAAESEIEDLEGSVAELETRLTAAEENIQGLQMTDISLDARITALEENGGGGGSSNETIAFSAVLTEYDTIGGGETAKFNVILLNEGNGYNSTTGVFTVPPGGGGLYYFSTHLVVSWGEAAYFDMRLNNAQICTAYSDMATNGASDTSQSGCSALVEVAEGDEIRVATNGQTDDTPLVETSADYLNGFNGFRI